MWSAVLMAAISPAVSVSGLVPLACTPVTVCAVMVASGRSVRSTSVKWMVPAVAGVGLRADEAVGLASSVTPPGPGFFSAPIARFSFWAGVGVGTGGGAGAPLWAAP